MKNFFNFFRFFKRLPIRQVFLNSLMFLGFFMRIGSAQNFTTEI